MSPHALCRAAALGLAVIAFNLAFSIAAAAPIPPATPGARWTNGPLADASFFPIAVWLQNPSRAARYREAGINTYVGLWRGPTEEQIAALKRAGMRLICHQNEVALRHRDDDTILGWMHGDEPDNAQSLGPGKGYGPPIPPERIVADYQRLRAADPSRPVLLNLGQGVAWDQWIGRGVRRNHPEDYPLYVRGCDIASFDIYPVAHEAKAVAGKLDFVARGVTRLKQWAGPDRLVWNCIECTRIHNPTRKATPAQVRAQVWMSLIHGSQGIIYFVHEWQPRFNEAALLDDPEMLAAVTVLNRQIASLASVLNSAPVGAGVEARSSVAEAPVRVAARRAGGFLYLFAVCMANQETEAVLSVPQAPAGAEAEVLGENRVIPARAGQIRDRFGPWEVHLYKVREG